MAKKFLTSINLNGTITASSDISAGGVLKSTQALTNEGGEIHLSAPSSGSTLNGPIVIDIYQNKLRFFENGGTARGYYIDLTTGGAGAGTNLVGGGSGTVTSVDMTVPTGLTVSGNPITTTGTLAVTLTAGYSIPTTSSQTNWDTAYTDRLKWDGGSTGLTASTGRTSLGATTVGSNLFTLTNPAAVTFLRVNADNTVSALDASTFRTAIGAGTSSTTGTVTSIATSTGLTGGTITTTGTLSIDTAVVPQLSAGNAFTGANTFTNGSGITVRNAATQDGVIIDGRAGGTTSLAVTIVPTTLTASRTLTLPDVTGTVVTTGDTGSVTSTMLAGSIANAKLSNSAITINSASTSLGGSVTLYAGTTTLQTSSANQAMTGILSVTMPGSTSGTAQIIPPAAAGTGTVITLPGSTGTLALNNQTMYIGTTSVAINRSSASLALTGITSIDGSAASVANSVTFTTTGGAAAGTTFNGSAARTIDYTTVGAAASGHNHSLDSLSNVTITSNASGEILKWNGSAWINNTLTEAGIMSNPMTTLGDIIYTNATPAPARLAGNTTTTKQFLSQTGTGTVSAAPAWGALAVADIPTLTSAKISDITLGGALTFSGAFTTTFTVTGNTSVTLPTSGTLVNSAVTTLSSLTSVGTLTGLTVTGSGTNAISLTTGTTGALTLDSGSTGAINIGTNANAKTVTVGNVTGASAVAINTGTGGFTVQTTGAGNVNIDTTNTAAHTVNIATGATLTATTKTINIGTSGAAGSTTNITIGSFNGASTTTVYGTLSPANMSSFTFTSGSNMIMSSTSYIYSPSTTNNIRVLDGSIQLNNPGGSLILGQTTTQDVTSPSIGGNTATTGTTLIITASNQIRKSSSSLRFKEGIQDISVQDSDILSIRPVTYYDKEQFDAANGDTSGLRKYFGIIAEEVLEIPGLSDLVLKDSEGQPESLMYDRITALLIQVARNQRDEIESLKAENESLSSDLAAIVARLDSAGI